MAEVVEDRWPLGSDRELERIAEALIYASGEPVAAEDIARTVADVSGVAGPTAEEIDRAVDRLNARYEDAESALRIHRWGGGFNMATTSDLSPYLKSHFDPERQMRLTRSLMETLAILAYRQPVTKPEIDFVRGVDSEYALRRLLEIGLVDVVGRADSVGRPLLYGTTPRFLQEFGLDDLESLPRLREIEELLGDPNFSRERAKLLALEGLERSEGPLSGASDDGPAGAGDDAGPEQQTGSGVDDHVQSVRGHVAE